MEIAKYEELVRTYAAKHKKVIDSRQRVVDLGKSLMYAHESEREAEKDERIAYAALIDYINGDIDAAMERAA